MRINPPYVINLGFVLAIVVEASLARFVFGETCLLEEGG